jgi:hypothetical protein
MLVLSNLQICMLTIAILGVICFLLFLIFCPILVCYWKFITKLLSRSCTILSFYEHNILINLSIVWWIIRCICVDVSMRKFSDIKFTSALQTALLYIFRKIFMCWEPTKYHWQGGGSRFKVHQIYLGSITDLICTIK